jgi:hypothetical protein
MKSLCFKILKGDYPELPGTYSQDLRDLVKEMLQRDPEDRPSIRKILEKDFLRARSERVVLTTFEKAKSGAIPRSGGGTENLVAHGGETVGKNASHGKAASGVGGGGSGGDGFLPLFLSEKENKNASVDARETVQQKSWEKKSGGSAVQQPRLLSLPKKKEMTDSSSNKTNSRGNTGEMVLAGIEETKGGRETDGKQLISGGMASSMKGSEDDRDDDDLELVKNMLDSGMKGSSAGGRGGGCCAGCTGGTRRFAARPPVHAGSGKFGKKEEEKVLQALDDEYDFDSENVEGDTEQHQQNQAPPQTFLTVDGGQLPGVNERDTLAYR